MAIGNKFINKIYDYVDNIEDDIDNNINHF